MSENNSLSNEVDPQARIERATLSWDELTLDQLIDARLTVNDREKLREQGWKLQDEVLTDDVIKIGDNVFPANGPVVITNDEGILLVADMTDEQRERYADWPAWTPRQHQIRVERAISRFKESLPNLSQALARQATEAAREAQAKISQSGYFKIR